MTTTTNNTTAMPISAADAVAVYNALLQKNAPAAELAKAETVLTDAVKADNMAMKEARVNALLDIRESGGETAFFDAFLKNRTYFCTAAVQNKDSKEYKLEDRTKPLRFEDLEKGFKKKFNDSTASLARDPRYVKLLGLLQWNLARSTTQELKTGDAMHLSNKQLETLRKEPELKVFTGATNGALLAQIQAIVNAILPDGYAPAMNSADRKYVQLASVAKVKRGTVTGAKDSNVLDEIITAVIVRKTGLCYKFQSKSAGMKPRKSDLTPKQEETFYKAPDRAPTPVQAADAARKDEKPAA